MEGSRNGSQDLSIQRLVTALSERLPNVSVSLEKEDRYAHASDKWPLAAKWNTHERRKYAPVVVVRPGDAEDVSAVLRFAATHELSLVPYGGGSGVVGAVVAGRASVSLDLTSILQKVEFDDASGHVTVSAGMLAGELERQLNERGRRLPHYPQSLEIATVGGLVATRSSGTFSSKYGNIEDLLVALEVVLADGSIIRTKAVPRSSTGPDITQLFVGSEGTLGVITKATLKTFPIPERTQFGGQSFADVESGLHAIRAVLDAGVLPAVIRLYDPREAVHLFERSSIPGSGQALLILGFDGAEEVVDAEASVTGRILHAAGGTNLGPEIGEAWERNRYDASWLVTGNMGDHRLADAIEVAAPWPLLAPLYHRVMEALEEHTDSHYAHYSHFYPNGGAIYFIFHTSGADQGAAVARYKAAWSTTIRTVLSMGGTISHHHGIGTAREQWMQAELGEAHAVLGRIKQAFDPQGILNPGKFGLPQQRDMEISR